MTQNPCASPDVSAEEEREPVPLKQGEGFVRPAVGCAFVVAWNMALAALIGFAGMLEVSGISFELACCLLGVTLPLLCVATLMSQQFRRFVFKPGAPVEEIKRRAAWMMVFWIATIVIALGAMLW